MTLPLSGRRVLVVSADGTLATLVAGAVGRLGADATVVPSGRATLHALSRGAVDLAVLDLPVADVSGGELLGALGRAKVPAVVISGVLRGAGPAEELRRLGAAATFEKPFAVDLLAAAVARALGVALPPDDELARDEVTGARPLAPEEVPDGISAAPLPLLDQAPVPGAAAPRHGLEAPLPDLPRARRLTGGDLPPPPRGDLARSPVPRLLVALHVGQATGALTLTRGPVRKIVVVERGVPVYAASNVSAERFGAICLRRGAVTEEALDAIRREEPGARTGEALVIRGLLAPERRLELVGGQIRAIVWSTFEWRDGSYEFQHGRPPVGRVPVRLAMAELVLEGMARASTLPRLRADLPANAHLAPSPDPAFELYALRLRAAEARLLALADGTKNVGDLLRLSELPERDALAFLQACRVMRVLDEVDRVLASTRRIGFM